MHMDALHACTNASCIRFVYQESTHFDRLEIHGVYVNSSIGKVKM